MIWVRHLKHDCFMYSSANRIQDPPLAVTCYHKIAQFPLIPQRQAPPRQKDEKASRDGFPILSKVRALLQLLGSSVAQHEEAECLVSSIVSKSFFAAAAAVRAALVISWPPRRSLCSRSPHVKSSRSCVPQPEPKVFQPRPWPHFHAVFRSRP